MRRAVSWPSRLGAWLSSGVHAFVLDVWAILPDTIRTTWRVVQWWLQRCGISMVPVCVQSFDATCMRRPARSVAAVHHLADTMGDADTRSVVCPMDLMPDEVVGLQLFAIADWQWLECAGPAAVRDRLNGAPLSDTQKKLRDRAAALRSGWDSPAETPYPFCIWSRMWVCRRRGLLVSTCAYRSDATSSSPVGGPSCVP